MRRLLLLPVLACAAAATARADAGDAWAVAKGAIPADTNYVVGINVDALRATSMFAGVYAHFTDHTETRGTIDQIRTACDIDVKDAVQGAVIAATDTADDGAVYLAGPRFDAKTVVECMQKFAAQSQKKQKVTAGAPDAQGIVELSADGEKEKLYFAFPKKGVMVMTFKPTQKKQLQRWLGGKGAGAGSDLGRSLGKVSPSSAIAWGALAGRKDLGDPGARVKAGVGQATAAGGKVQIEVRATMASAKDAQNGKAMVQRELGDMRKEQGTPPEVLRALDTLKTSVAGDELTVTATMPEADVSSLLKQMH
ncbi:MAG TPA: hypothetical protein VKE22_27245 [Haliangiales bacterium]|nr:hypothetical protein [Haliangiales bacterium]